MDDTITFVCKPIDGERRPGEKCNGCPYEYHVKLFGHFLHYCELQDMKSREEVLVRMPKPKMEGT